MAVTSTNNLKKGSQGSDVTELQKLLNQNGYNLAEDGIFGNNTLSAVKDYQQKNNLAVDGIVGTNTWGSLTGGSSTTTPEATEPTTPAWEYTPYTPSDTVKQAEALLQEQLAQKPGSYTSAWQDQLNETLNKILNREKFSYDLNGDMLYQQYKDQYTTQGKLAMMDTMGQTAAMTGGYGNSYAQTAGQQAYQGYLQGLNDKIPELYQLALSKYNTEGDTLRDQASMIAQMEEQDYGRYRDQVSDYYTEVDRLTDESRYQGEQDYGKWADDLNFTYQQERDKVSDSQWQAQFDEAKRQYDEQMALSKSKSSSTGTPKRVVDDVDKGDGPVVVEDPPAGNGDITYGTILDKLRTWTSTEDEKTGKLPSKSEINTYLRSAYKAGYITQAEYNQLKNLYAPKGYTY